MPKVCDNISVGVIIESPEREIVLLKRAKFPIGYAPPAGHGDLDDEHGSIEQAAVGEVSQEVGLTIATEGLTRTVVNNRRVYNQCRREGGTYHNWFVFEARDYSGTITPSPDETQGARWYPQAEVQELADRTKDYEAGNVTEEAWAANPGLEPIWKDFFVELGRVE